ncbi:MAG: phosphatidylglycerol lysyltransferase domain-containing protein [Clostridiales bacterium]|nr:phosphatidylglycerol lysyltransferase domain-containing protein [Clostridiales bacterium]
MAEEIIKSYENRKEVIFMPSRLNFKNVELGDRDLLDKYLKKESGFIGEHNFADLYMWAYEYKSMYALYNGYLYIKMTSPEKGADFYLMPFGDRSGFCETLKVLIDEGKRTDGKLYFCFVSRWQKEIAEMVFKDNINLVLSRDFADYIYLSEKLIELKGKKLHGKKNHLNRFMKDNEGRWNYEDLDDFNAEEFYAFQLKWVSLHNPKEFEGETAAVKALLEARRELGVKGGLIRLEGKVIAMTLGTEFNSEVFVVNIEKALPNMNGAYQIINNEFAKRNLKGYKYINREEDMGLEGLRQAKMSYAPEFLGEAYEGYYCDKIC